MVSNRSMPKGDVIPVLGYADVGEAVGWLTLVFGFRERIRIGDHRAQLNWGSGSVVVRQDSGKAGGTGVNHSVMVRVDDVDSHFAAARAAGAVIVSPPTDQPYGERQYSCVDIGGHLWTFSQSIADVDPADWGGTAVDLG